MRIQGNLFHGSERLFPSRTGCHLESHPPARNAPSTSINPSKTPGRSEMNRNLPSGRTSTSPAVSSSLIWCDSVAGEMASAERASMHAMGQLALATRSNSSNRLGSASAFSIAVRRTRLIRVVFAAPLGLFRDAVTFAIAS
jgi:hypothetical protein